MLASLRSRGYDAATMTNPPRYQAPALKKGLEILELLATSEQALTMSDISAALGRSVGEIFRMLQVLEEHRYIARDDDAAGNGARDSLIERATAAGIDAVVLSPSLGDFNEDLRLLGADALSAALHVQLAPEDAVRFMAIGAI